MHMLTLGEGYFDYRTMNSQNSDPNSYLFSNISSECQKWGPCSLVNHMFLISPWDDPYSREKNSIVSQKKKNPEEIINPTASLRSEQ